MYETIVNLWFLVLWFSVNFARVFRKHSGKGLKTELVYVFEETLTASLILLDVVQAMRNPFVYFPSFFYSG